MCLDCKRQGTVCIEVAQGVPCLGPITQSGCGAICPGYQRGCYGCFGPAAQANGGSLVDHFLAAGVEQRRLVPLLRNFNAGAEEFRRQSDRVEHPTGTEPTP